jgi:hypothetical protein
MAEQPRVAALLARLEKGRQKTCETFSSLTAEQWQAHIYAEPDWTPRSMLAHFLSAERQLLVLAQNVAGGGTGGPEGFDIDGFNSAEQQRLNDQSPQMLLDELDQARRQTIGWVGTLAESQLDRVGRHPGLGLISVEMMITAMYGHQLLHVRDLLRNV